MKFVIGLTLCIIAVYATPLHEVEKAEGFVRVPDGFGGMRLASVAEVYEEVKPSSVPADDMVFHLFTRNNPTVSQILRFDDMSTVVNSNWSPARETKILCHGWQRWISLNCRFKTANKSSDYSTVTLPTTGPLTTAAYLENADVNVM